MSIFGNIMSAIFGRAGATHGAQPSQGSPSSQGSQPSAAPTGPATSGASSGSSSAASGQGTGQKSTVDVEAVLKGLAANKKEKLNWRTSIVDLMKVLDLDSSLAARKQLAQELHYSGDASDSAAMNVWLHKQVMIKLAENGGKVPEDLKH